jgi:Tfp pilus assembly protein PilO
VTDLNQKLTAARARAGQLSKIQAEMAGLQVEVAQLEKQLPKNRELPSLIRVFTHRAEAYGLSLSSFAPGKAVSKGLYDEIPYVVALTTSFHSLARFVTALGKGERLFATRNLALTQASAKTDPSKTVNATFTLVAFKYHE